MACALIILGWTACALLCYGLTFATFQREFPRSTKSGEEGDFVFSIFMGILGPIGLVIVTLVLLLFGVKIWKHGFKFWPNGGY